MESLDKGEAVVCTFESLTRVISGPTRSPTFRFSNPGGCRDVCVTFCLMPSVFIFMKEEQPHKQWGCNNSWSCGLLNEQVYCVSASTPLSWLSPKHSNVNVYPTALKSKIWIWCPHSVTHDLATNVPLGLSGLQAHNIPNTDYYSLLLPPLIQRMTAAIEAK